MGSRIHLGAVLFDSEDHPGMGWACRAGAPPFRIAGVHSLSSDTLWWVSIDYQRMVESGLAQHAFFRGEGFLRLSMQAALRELGLRNAHGCVAEPQRASAWLATIFERVVALQCAFMGIEREHWRPPRTILRSALREMLIPPDEPLDATLSEAVREAGQAFSRCRPLGNGNQRKNRVLGFLPIPRLAHTQAIAECPVPANTAYQRLTPPKRTDHINEWLDEHRGPMLVRARIQDFPPELSKLINFGAMTSTYTQATRAGRGYKAASARQWITSDEARVYAQNAQLEISEALWWPQWVQPREAITSLATFFGHSEPLDHLSYSVGVFAENLWTALTLTLAAHDTDHNVAQNVIAPFLRAADRMACLRHVIRVANQGAEVMGFGVGRVGVYVSDHERGCGDEAARIAATAGLVPPFPVHGVTSNSAPPIVSDDTVYRSLVEMISLDMRDTFDGVDAEVVAAFTKPAPCSMAS